MSEVAILGCGPAGLLAALATEQAGHEPVIYSYKIKSTMPGAQFLHKPIPGVTPERPDATVLFTKVGTREGYARKVYGRPTAPCSWDQFPAGLYGVWSMGKLYDALWERFESRINDVDCDEQFLNALDARLVLSTIPAIYLCCGQRHEFRSQEVFIRTRPSSSLRGRYWDHVEYNGTTWDPYYRRSYLFGRVSEEFGHWVSDSVRGEKPLGTDCDCRPSIKRLGRFGQWRKGVLIHHAYHDAKGYVNAL